MSDSPGPTDEDVRKIVGEVVGPGLESLIEQGMDRVDRKYGSWDEFNNSKMHDIIMFVEEQKHWIRRNEGNGC